MKNDVKSISKRFIKNIGYCDLISAIVYTMRGKTIDYKNIEECLNVMRRKFTFDKIDRSLVAARMSLVDEKDMYLADIIDVYRKVEKGRLEKTLMAGLASVIICDAGKAQEADSVLKEAENLWEKMKKNHPENIEDADLCSAILLVLTGKSTYDILVELENMYSQLETCFEGREDLAYALCRLFATYNENAEDKCEKMIRLTDKLRERHIIYGKKSEYAIVGLLADISVDAKEIVSDVSKVCDYLSKQSGFGNLYMGAQTRSAFAFMIVYLSYYRDGLTMSTQAEEPATPKPVVHRTILYSIMNLILKYKKQDYENVPESLDMLMDMTDLMLDMTGHRLL